MKYLLPTLLLLGAASSAGAGQVISSVDTSLSGSEKYVLRVDGKPFFYNGVQIRNDYAHYRWGWSDAQTARLYKQAAADGFTVANFQLFWYDVEREKDVFDWSRLDAAIEMAEAAHIKLEILWFGTQSYGGMSPTGGKDGHLRVPNYVLSVKDDVPQPGDYLLSRNADGSYTRSDNNAFQLELCDDTLMARETYVLSKVMAHVAAYDAAHGRKHTVVGVQVDNEVHTGTRNGDKDPTGKNDRSHSEAANRLYASGNWTNPVAFNRYVVQRYLSHVAGAVKQSDYSVWTRANQEHSPNWVANNEAARAEGGTNIDFVGPDSWVGDMKSVFASVPRRGFAVGKNFWMIMETAGVHPLQANRPITALAGNTAYNIYMYTGTGPDVPLADERDGIDLYRVTGSEFAPTGDFVAGVRKVNLMLAKDKVDLATKRNGRSLYVYNRLANSDAQEIGVDGIRYDPACSTDQGIAIRRSQTEYVLMSSGGGTFYLPSGIRISGAGAGAFDDKNKWQASEPKDVSLEGRHYTINLKPHEVVRVVYSGKPPRTYVFEAEALPVVDKSATATIGPIEAEYALSANKAGSMSARGVGDYATMRLPLVAAGSYRIRVGVRRDVRSGVFQTALAPAGSDAFSNLGEPKDNYEAGQVNTGPVYDEIDIGTYQAASTGPSEIRFTVTGKNADSAGYGLVLDYVKLIPDLGS